MSAKYRTQCPRCQTIYPMPDEKLNQPKVRANCGKCHHTFFLNAHLIAPDLELSKPKAPTPRPKPAPPQASTQPVPQKPTLSAQQAVAEARAKHQAQLVAKVNAKFKELNGELSEDGSVATDIDFEDESIVAPPSVAGMDFDGLDDFLNGDFEPAPMESASNKNPTVEIGEEELWASQILAEAENNKPKASAIGRPKDDMSDVFGSEFDDIPVVSATATLDKKELQRRAEQRITSQGRSQEQLVKERGVIGQILWLISCVVMSVLMVGQYVVFNSDGIIKHGGVSLPLLKAGCEMVSCRLPSADLPAFQSGYELQLGRTAGTTNLIGTLKNISGDDQLYPNLKIVVYGNHHLVGEFIATPKDYLTTEQRFLSKNQGKRYMFTLPNVTPSDIKRVQIEPFY